MRLKSVETLRALMNQEAVSIGSLAASSGCSKGFISHLLAGRRRSCTAALAARISSALGVPVTVLFEISKPVPADAVRILGPYRRIQRRE
ncbi:helix-turn-helix domain-containing protein [Psychromicrobium sp. YIM B11713]|uniref:helix-turn-helix domain-containing protein n=1 Tax=Psychromicrobium sp. YIM B11713 TaxID=3145233 RepID=UPI00374F969D